MSSRYQDDKVSSKQCLVLVVLQVSLHHQLHLWSRRCLSGDLPSPLILRGARASCYPALIRMLLAFISQVTCWDELRTNYSNRNTEVYYKLWGECVWVESVTIHYVKCEQFVQRDTITRHSVLTTLHWCVCNRFALYCDTSESREDSTLRHSRGIPANK